MPNNSKLQHSPTRNTLSCILTSQAECYTTSGSLPGPLGLSDHDLIFTVWKNENSRPKPCSWSARALAKKGGFMTTSCHKYHLICCEKFRTETNCPSTTSNILPLLLGKIIRQCYKVTSLKRNLLKKFSCDAFFNAKHPEEFCPLVLVKAYIASSSLKSVVLFPTLSL